MTGFFLRRRARCVSALLSPVSLTGQIRPDQRAGPPGLRLLVDAGAEAGTGVAHCPISNMKLSSGVCRVPELLALGAPVGLAVDGSASNDGSSLLEELRVGYLLHRLHASERAPSGYDMLKLASSMPVSRPSRTTTRPAATV